MPRYMQFKFQPKSSIHAEVINILVYPRWRPAAILDFQNFVLLMKFSNFCYAKVYAVQISAKSSIHAEVINILVNSRWRPAAILDFQHFALLMFRSEPCGISGYMYTFKEWLPMLKQFVSDQNVKNERTSRVLGKDNGVRPSVTVMIESRA